MKKIFLFIIVAFCVNLSIFSQATSLTVDCQTPGWLSSKINYGDQQTLENLKVTGYINSSDLAFIGTLMDYKLKGKLDLSDVFIIKNGENEPNTLPKNSFSIRGEKHLEYLALPNSLTSISSSWSGNSWDDGQLLIDTLIIGGEALPQIYLSQLCPSSPIAIKIRDGVKHLKNSSQQSNLYRNMNTSFSSTRNILLPSTLKTIARQFFAKSTSIQSLNIPDSLEEIGEYAFAGTNCLPKTIFVPYAIEKFYLNSFLKTIPEVLYFSENTSFIDNSEYYDNNSGSSWYQSNTGYRPVISDEPVIIHIKGNKIPLMAVANKYDNNSTVFKNCTFYVSEEMVEQYKNQNYYKNGTILPEKEIEELIVDKKGFYYVGDQFIFSASYSPSDATDNVIRWKSNDSSVITLTENGEALFNKFGHTTILAFTSYNRLSEKIEIDVFEHTTGVEVDKNELFLRLGQTDVINALVYPLEYSDGQVSWKSSNNDVATVDSKGNVTAVKAGECIITCITQDRGYKANCYVKVEQPVEAVTILKHSTNMKVGETENLYAQISPSNADNKSVIWFSSDEQLATVSENGEVKALEAGVLWIKAISEDNTEAKDSCKVTVLQPVNGLTLDESAVTLNSIGQVATLTATVIPEDASNKDVRWTSTNESVCIVSNGTIVAVGEGISVIIATTVDGGYIATCTVTVTSAQPTEIQSIHETNALKYKIYDLLGREKSSFQKGVNIIRFADGTTRKVSIK